MLVNLRTLTSQGARYLESCMLVRPFNPTSPSSAWAGVLCGLALRLGKLRSGNCCKIVFTSWSANLALLLRLPPLCPARFLSSDNPFTGGWGHCAPFAGTDRNNLLPLDLCPPRPLSGRNSLASRSRNGALFASCNSTFRPTSIHVDLPEGGQGGCHAVQLILKSLSFLLEFADYGLHQCFWHDAIRSLGIGPKTVSAEGLGQLAKYQLHQRRDQNKTPQAQRVMGRQSSNP